MEKNKINLELNNPAKSPVQNGFIIEIVRQTIGESDLRNLKRQKVSLSVAIISEKEIRKINKNYRGKNLATDVLTFCEFKNTRQLEKALAVEKEVFLGEMLLCYNNIESFAVKTKINLKKELANVISHGMLHLLGYRHGQKMFKIQERVAKLTGAR